MESLHLPPPIVIAPIDDEPPLPTQLPGNQNPPNVITIEPRDPVVPPTDNMAPLAALAQQNQNLFYQKTRNGVFPHNPHGPGPAMMPNNLPRFPPSASPFPFAPQETNNNTNFAMNTNGFPRFPQNYRNMISHYYSSNKTLDRFTAPTPHFPGYNEQMFGGLSSNRPEQPGAFGGAGFNPYYPPTSEQYMASMRMPAQPMLPFCDGLPQQQGGVNIAPQQISPQQMSADRIPRPVNITYQCIDGKQIPCVQRGNEFYTSVRTVEVKLLSRFPNSYPDEVKQRPPIRSTKMNHEEANAFNKLNKESRFEFGMEPFENDLLVRLNDFQDFYNIIKRHFPSTPTRSAEGSYTHSNNSPLLAACQQRLGGWLQMNNTIVPYILRGEDKYLPICIVKYAAGLPINDGPFHEYLTSEECNFLNEQCKLAGLTFSFHTMTVVGSLDKILQLSDLRLIIKELPVTNPFDSATYDPSLEQSTTKPVENGNKDQTNKNPSTVTSEKSYPQMPPLVRMKFPEKSSSIKSVSQQREQIKSIQDPIKKNHCYTSKQQSITKASQPTPTEHVNKSTPGQYQQHKAPSYSVKNNTENVPQAHQQRSINGSELKQYVNKDTSHGPNIASYVFKAKDKKSPEVSPPSSHTAEKKRKLNNSTDPCGPKLGNSQGSFPKMMKNNPKLAEALTVSNPALAGALNDNSSVHQDLSGHKATQKSPNSKVPQIVSEQVEGRSLSCLKRADGHVYALVEAIARVYFPHKEVSEVLHVVTDVLGIKTEACTEAEQRAYISFYGLKTSELPNPALMKVDMLKQFFNILKYMFIDNNKDQAKGNMETEKSKWNPALQKRDSINSPQKMLYKKKKHKKKKSKRPYKVMKKLKLSVVLHDFMESASLRKELCKVYQVKIRV